jgi:hypothetical protein
MNNLQRPTENVPRRIHCEFDKRGSVPWLPGFDIAHGQFGGSK